MFLRRLGKRGTAIVEYAIILAFAAAVGSSFTSDNGMTGSIKSIIGNVNQMLGVAAGKDSSNTQKDYNVVYNDNALQYQLPLENMLDGLFSELHQDGKILTKVWIAKDGHIKNYSLYDPEKNRTDSYGDKTNINVNDFFSNKNYGIGVRGETCLNFATDGTLMANNGATKYTEWTNIYLTKTDSNAAIKLSVNGSGELVTNDIKPLS